MFGNSLADEWEEMCIVSVNEPVARALEGTVFRQLLRGLGLQPPSQQVPPMCSADTCVLT